MSIGVNQSSPIEPSVSYPSTAQMAKNVISQVKDSAIGVMRGRGLLASKEKAEARFAICRECEFLDKERGRCIKCGCFMAKKTGVEVAKCPIGKWGDLQGFTPISDISSNIPSK